MCCISYEIFLSYARLSAKPFPTTLPIQFGDSNSCIVTGLVMKAHIGWIFPHTLLKTRNSSLILELHFLLSLLDCAIKPSGDLVSLYWTKRIKTFPLLVASKIKQKARMKTFIKCKTHHRCFHHNDHYNHKNLHTLYMTLSPNASGFIDWRSLRPGSASRFFVLGVAGC